jgi:aryl-alcohol dehydrogenase-like predicted oxidoreductase
MQQLRPFQLARWRTVKFRGGPVVPAIGQDSWHIWQGRRLAAEEEGALRTGLSLGMTLIDTSGNYGEGRSKELIGRDCRSA